MYHWIVRRRVRRQFDALTRGDWSSGMDSISPYVHHVFPGDHALGGERHSRDAMRTWFERLYRLFPGLRFTVNRVVATGWPWSTWVAVEWIDDTTTASGDAYRNEGAHWFHLRWGKADVIHAYLDSQRVAEACEEMARAGIDEAAAAPIVS